MNQKEITKAIYDALDEIFTSDVTIIYADQNEARPARPYATYKIISGPTREGWDAETVNEDGNLEFSGFRMLVVSVNYYGLNALQGLASLQNRLQWPSIREILLTKKLVYVSDSGVRDVSLLLETQTETRAQMDITMRFVDYDVDEGSGVITRVELESEIDNVEQDILIIDSQGDE